MTQPNLHQPDARPMRFVPQHILFMLLLLPAIASAAPNPSVAISQAKWAKGVLSVKGSVRHSSAASIDVYDGSGRLLGQATVDGRHRFALRRTDLDRPELLCSLQAKASDAAATVAVKGKPKSCGKVPQCKILSPVGSVTTTVNTDVSFKAKATPKDRKAGPLKMEWDFGGGAMGEAVPGATPATYLRPAAPETTVQFVRDNARYWVRFTAWDQRNRYCEDSVEVIVGTPPDALEEFATTRDAVAALADSARQSAPGLAGAGSGKVVLPFEDWSLQNITDARTAPNLPTPFGPQVNTINAVVYGKAKLPVMVGDDSIELSYAAASNPADPAGKDSINTTSQNWPADRTLMQAAVQKSDFFEVWSGPADVSGWSYAGRAAAFRVFDPLTSLPDEGYHNPDLIPALNPDHGRYMPGIGGPYAVNEPQAFSEFVADSNGFAAKMLPVTDIDDLGRVNPYPLFRVTAKDKATGATDSTDMVLTASRDLHCRECHAKGGIGARAGSAIHHHDHSGHGDGTAEFFEPASDSLFDQEYAALRNVMVIHGLSDFATGPLSKTCADSGCHHSAIATVPYGQTLPSQETSIRVHGFHGVLQYNAARDDIQRDDQGLPVRFKPAQTDAAAGANPNSLFPVKDAEGNLLPMEQNCLRCHAGLREQCYRDRMYGAGVTCYQCHGDMLAVAGSYPKSSFSPDGNAKREAWIDQPDCASCHVGNGNRGRSGVDGFFSAGVLRTAFDETDPSATPRRPDRFNPDEGRFAVTPVTEIKLVELGNGEFQPLIVALFRQGKDRHGQVPCAACHGAAHAVWPNRDPNANDNVTALQLQGHAGPIAACSTCHTPEAFERFEDLDQGSKAPEPKTGVLGGPHNLHPVDDPNWWQQAALDTTPNASSGKVAGGWHNDYAKLPGAAGEDQCAACHGNDHRGTRLSRTPVERTFVTKKGKTVRVKAGDAIGCDLCHSIRKSCNGSPNPDCGRSSEQTTGTTNQAPVFATQPPSEARVGQDYRYAVHATDPEGEVIRYSTSWLAAGGLTIDPQSGVLNIAAPNLTGLPQNVDHEFAAADGHFPPLSAGTPDHRHRRPGRLRGATGQNRRRLPRRPDLE